ncbi:hypothetical protein K4K60_001278 [Colletotrichum sp. SAR11_57]|nr:hypothetical protein K4K60_001278 [Colletotrichum sp. SAR11_57]
MRAYDIALLGFTALSIAAPQFGIGEGSVILIPGGNSPINPPITAPDVRPGKRQIETTVTRRDGNLDALRDTYLSLLEPYTGEAKPSVGTYMILLHLADILAGNGIVVDTIVLGEATTVFGPSTKRQIFEIGRCKDSDVIGLRATLTSLLLIYGNKPPFEIWNLEQAIIAALKACGQDIGVSPIIPDQPIPGGPLIPAHNLEASTSNDKTGETGTAEQAVIKHFSSEVIWCLFVLKLGSNSHLKAEE